MDWRMEERGYMEAFVDFDVWPQGGAICVMFVLRLYLKTQG